MVKGHLLPTSLWHINAILITCSFIGGVHYVQWLDSFDIPWLTFDMIKVKLNSHEMGEWDKTGIELCLTPSRCIKLLSIAFSFICWLFLSLCQPVLFYIGSLCLKNHEMDWWGVGAWECRHQRIIKLNNDFMVHCCNHVLFIVGFFIGGLSFRMITLWSKPTLGGRVVVVSGAVEWTFNCSGYVEQLQVIQVN